MTDNRDDTIEGLFSKTFGKDGGPGKDDDENVTVLPGTIGPYALARKILAFTKDDHDDFRVRGIIAFATIETTHGTGVVPFNSGVGLVDMALVAMSCNSLSVQYMIAAQEMGSSKDSPPDRTA